MEAGSSAGGLSAVSETRREADLAVERLVQEHGVDRGVVFIEPVGEAATTGSDVGGGDAAGASPSPGERRDAPLRGAIRLTVAVTDQNRSVISDALGEAGAHKIAPA